MSETPERPTDSPEPSSERSASVSPESPPRSAAIRSGRGKSAVVWVGFILFALLLVLPTGGSHGVSSHRYQGQPFFCGPALGPTSYFYTNLWEPVEEVGAEPAADAALLLSKVTRIEAEAAYRTAVCGQQRSRRIGWALVVVVPTMFIAISGRRGSSIRPES